MSDARLKVFLARPSERGARALLLDCRRGGRPTSGVVVRWLLCLPRWDDLSTELKEIAAEAAEELLPSGFRRAGFDTFTLGDQRHDIARYSGPDGDFALIPGGRVTLGWDRSAVALTSLQRAAWNQANDDPAFVRFEQLLDIYFTPSREVTVDPLLVEMDAQDVYTYIDAEEEQEPGVASPQSLLERGVDRQGFRLLSSDEWEHACRAGSGDLFRWGDEWPRGVPQGESTDFSGHIAPNGFGLRLASDPFEVECVSGGDVFRGGDAGGAICGGRPQPEPWYSFASAFAYPLDFAAEDVDEFFEAAVVRRALSLPDTPPRGTR